ncbi:MAG: DUF1330 domain-containing protein [Pseudolabrys sp.]
MRYLIASGLPSAQLSKGCTLVADGEAIALETPWTFGAPLIARVDDGADLSILNKPGISAFLVEGQAEPNTGQAFAIGAHIMRDPEGFKPYALGVPPVIKNYGCHYVARGGAVTTLSGSFVPDRVVLMQFPDADRMVDFYFCDGYAPLLPIRLKTTEPRFVVMARSGAMPERARRIIAARLPGALAN